MQKNHEKQKHLRVSQVFYFNKVLCFSAGSIFRVVKSKSEN